MVWQSWVRGALGLALAVSIAGGSNAQSGVEVKLASSRTHTNPDPDLSVLLATIFLQGPGIPEIGGLFGARIDRAVGSDGTPLVADSRWALMPPSLAPRQGGVAHGETVFWRPVTPEPSAISFSGAALFYSAEGVKDAVITIPDILEHAGRHGPVQHPVLQELGVGLYVLTPEMLARRAAEGRWDGLFGPGDHAALDAILDQTEATFARSRFPVPEPDIALVTPEPEDMLKIMDVRFLDEEGRELPAANGETGSSTIGYRQYVRDPQQLADAQIQLFLRVPGTVTEYPFAFEGVALPCVGDHLNPCQ